MPNVLQLEVPVAPLWPAEGSGPLLIETAGGALTIGHAAPGVLLVDEDGATALVSQQSQAFMLAAGEQGPPGASGMELLGAATGEPTGVVDRSQSTPAFEPATRTVALTPIGVNFETYSRGTLRQYPAAQSLQLPNTSGIYHCYFDKDTGLPAYHFGSPIDLEILRHHVYFAAIYWNAVQGRAVYRGDERHGHKMDSETHIYRHRTAGAQLVPGGCAITGMVVDGSGASNAHAQHGVASGTIYDEDLDHAIAHGAPQTLSPIARLPINWRVGSTWYTAPPDDYSALYNGRDGYAGTVAHNYDAGGGVWALGDVAANQYFLTHVVATNDWLYPVQAIMGGTYNTKANARQAALTEFARWSDFPFEETVKLATLIGQYKPGFTNAPKFIWASTDEGGDYVDWRAQVVGVSGQSQLGAEIFIAAAGALPVVGYAAVGFEELAGYPGLYLERVNVP